jgi:hypothetical protein
VLTGLLWPQETTTFKGNYYELPEARRRCCCPAKCSSPATRPRRRQPPRPLARQGAELAIVYLSPPHTPAVLEPLASALSELS